MIKTVQRFVACMTDLALRAVSDEVERALGRTSGHRARQALEPPFTSYGSHPGRPRGSRGIRRTTSELEEASARFASFVEANPGLRIEQINRRLGTTTKDLSLPIRKLVAEGVIKPEGRIRSTRYFMAVPPPAAPRARSGLETYPVAASGADAPRPAPPI